MKNAVTAGGAQGDFLFFFFGTVTGNKGAERWDDATSATKDIIFTRVQGQNCWKLLLQCYSNFFSPEKNNLPPKKVSIPWFSVVISTGEGETLYISSLTESVRLFFKYQLQLHKLFNSLFSSPQLQDAFNFNQIWKKIVTPALLIGLLLVDRATTLQEWGQLGGDGLGLRCNPSQPGAFLMRLSLRNEQISALLLGSGRKKNLRVNKPWHY